MKITRTAMPIFQKIFVGEMEALDMEAMGAYYAAMARKGCFELYIYQILKLKTLETSKYREKELGETGLWLMSYCTKNGEIS